MTTGWILAAVAAVIVIYLIVVFNRLVRQRNVVREGWSGIDVQLKRRTDLVPNLVETVKAYAAHERFAVRGDRVAARARASPPSDVSGQANAERALSGSLGKLMAVAEAYPDLKANQNFLELQNQLAEIEDQIQMSRRYYNGAVRNLNISIQSFPDVVVARHAGLPRGAVLRAGKPRRGGGSADRLPGRRRHDGAARAVRSRSACCSLAAAPAAAVERIIQFISDVVVERNGDLLVTETIRVRGRRQRHPPRHLARFPDCLSAPRRTRVEVGFTCRSRSRATARPRTMCIEAMSNGVRVRIGSADRLISRGQHTT